MDRGMDKYRPMTLRQSKIKCKENSNYQHKIQMRVLYHKGEARHFGGVEKKKVKKTVITSVSNRCMFYITKQKHNIFEGGTFFFFFLVYLKG